MAFSALIQVYGEMIFTTFADKEVFGNTITTGVTASGNNIYNNEPPEVFTGNGETLTSYVESGDFDVADGNALMFMDRVIPDFDLSGGKIKMEITTKQYPEQPDVNAIKNYREMVDDNGKIPYTTFFDNR